jgi:hypothetical protein
MNGKSFSASSLQDQILCNYIMSHDVHCDEVEATSAFYQFMHDDILSNSSSEDVKKEKLYEMYQRLVPPIPKMPAAQLNAPCLDLNFVVPCSISYAIHSNQNHIETVSPKEIGREESQEMMLESIESSTESEQEFIVEKDTNYKNYKLARRRERNRLAARRSRKRKAIHISSLEKELEHLRKENEDLKLKLTKLVMLRQKSN